MHSSKIAEILAPISESYRSQGNVHKYHAYRNAIDSIKRFDTVITSSDQLRELKGVGWSMLEKVAEILKTGELQQEKKVLADPIAQALKIFTDVHGVGPVMARKLVHEHGLRTLEDLRDSGLQLTPQVRLGLKYHEEAAQRISFDEIEHHLVFLQAAAAKVDKGLSLSICGSHRRGLATSGDIDVLLTHPKSHSDSGCEYVFMAVFLAKLRESGYVVDTLVEGAHKFMGYCKLKCEKSCPSCGGATGVHRLDMRWFSFDSFFPALLYFTGSDMFNVNFRVQALKHGFTVNEYGIYKVDGPAPSGQDAAKPASPSKLGGTKGEKIDVQSEEDIFSLIKMPYVEPKKRCT